MATFEDLLENEQKELDKVDAYLRELAFESMSEGELDELRKEIKEEHGYTDDDHEAIEEALKRRVTSKGKISRTKSRQQRSRRATQTTKMSKSKLKRRAKKAARTRKKNPAKIKKAIRKRNRAMKKRKQMGIK